jgi:hypothetical protein
LDANAAMANDGEIASSRRTRRDVRCVRVLASVLVRFENSRPTAAAGFLTRLTRRTEQIGATLAVVSMPKPVETNERKRICGNF